MPLVVLLAFMLAALFQPLPARAQSVTTYHGCIGADGEPVASMLDDRLATAFERRLEHARPVIRYNPARAPGLTERARLFLYAHECAHARAATVLRTPDADHRADCQALETLLRSGLLATTEVAALQAELPITPDDWREVGPPRAIDLPGCLADARAHPSLTAPLPGQDAWNSCARACGDTLLSCQRRSCGGVDCATCRTPYERCVSVCDFAHGR